MSQSSDRHEALRWLRTRQITYFPADSQQALALAEGLLEVFRGWIGAD